MLAQLSRTLQFLFKLSRFWKWLLVLLCWLARFQKDLSCNEIISLLTATIFSQVDWYSSTLIFKACDLCFSFCCGLFNSYNQHHPGPRTTYSLRFGVCIQLAQHFYAELANPPSLSAWEDHLFPVQSEWFPVVQTACCGERELGRNLKLARKALVLFLTSLHVRGVELDFLLVVISYKGLLYWGEGFLPNVSALHSHSPSVCLCASPSAEVE